MKSSVQLLLFSLVITVSGQVCADDALLMTEEQVREKHAGKQLREPIFEPPGTARALYLNEINRTRTYGFDTQGRVVLIIEESNRAIPRGTILSECRSTNPWFWHVKMKDGSEKWVPVGTIPSEARTNSPTQHQKSDGTKTAPDAFAKAKRNGNLVLVWDKGWASNPDDADFLKLEEGLELMFDKIETLKKEGKPVLK